MKNKGRRRNPLDRTLGSNNRSDFPGCMQADKKAHIKNSTKVVLGKNPESSEVSKAFIARNYSVKCVSVMEEEITAIKVALDATGRDQETKYVKTSYTWFPRNYQRAPV